MQLCAATFRRGNKTYHCSHLVVSCCRQSDGHLLHHVFADLPAASPTRFRWTTSW